MPAAEGVEWVYIWRDPAPVPAGLSAQGEECASVEADWDGENAHSDEGGHECRHRLSQETEPTTSGTAHERYGAMYISLSFCRCKCNNAQAMWNKCVHIHVISQASYGASTFSIRHFVIATNAGMYGYARDLFVQKYEDCLWRVQLYNCW